MNQNTGQGSDEQGAEHVGYAKKGFVDRSQLDQLARAARNVGEDVANYVRRRPVAAIGIAAGAAFVAGTVLGSRVGRFALIMAAGSLAQDILDESLGEGGVKKLVTDELSRLVRSRASS
jgi:hypothetical protein